VHYVLATDLDRLDVIDNFWGVTIYLIAHIVFECMLNEMYIFYLSTNYTKNWLQLNVLNKNYN